MLHTHTEGLKPCDIRS